MFLVWGALIKIASNIPKLSTCVEFFVLSLKYLCFLLAMLFTDCLLRDKLRKEFEIFNKEKKSVCIDDFFQFLYLPLVFISGAAVAAHTLVTILHSAAA